MIPATILFRNASLNLLIDPFNVPAFIT